VQHRRSGERDRREVAGGTLVGQGVAVQLRPASVFEAEVVERLAAVDPVRVRREHAVDDTVEITLAHHRERLGIELGRQAALHQREEPALPYRDARVRGVLAVAAQRGREPAWPRCREPVQKLLRGSLGDQARGLRDLRCALGATSFEPDRGHRTVGLERVPIAAAELPELAGPVAVQRPA
jgi:hypothetical protein